PSSVILAIDESALRLGGGVPKIRPMVAEALEALSNARAKAVAVDVILADKQDDAVDVRLENALARVHNLVLPCEEVNGRWEDPVPGFSEKAAALGHIHPGPDRDGVSRGLPLELTAGGERRWALSLQAFRMARKQPIIESPDDLQIGDTVIPAARAAGSRALRIRYLTAGVPVVTLQQLRQNPALKAEFAGKVVFIGVTALTAARDRLLNPYGQNMPGVEIHAQAYETLSQGRFLASAPDHDVLALGLLLCAGAGLIFAFLPGWRAYTLALVLLGLAHVVPVWFFRSGVIFPYFIPVSVAWLSVVGSASYEYFVLRGKLGRSESERERYQQAIHFVTHEMRTPLTAIQGSSELMGRYNLNDEKRKQIAGMINSESKRLARMIQTFLDIERLTDGQMELKREPFAMRDILTACLDRARPLAERKRIGLFVQEPVAGTLTGDRELMEYAVYNLITNAIKYSPSETEVLISSRPDGGHLRLSVRDQGIGMDGKELRNIFTKFYRTRKAEASGEVGTGIGLSIVQQIVLHHGGKMEVSSTPGKGSCFTIVLPGKEEKATSVSEQKVKQEMERGSALDSG
ncbi:MAG: CHASE2 domain-containing protein, partial [Bryobacteraceae bacterium]